MKTTPGVFLLMPTPQGVPVMTPVRHALAALALTLMAGAALALPAAAQTAAISSQMQPMLNASGNGRVMVAPDIAIVTMGVVTRANTAGDAIAANATDAAKVVDTIRAAGVMDKDIATSGFAVNPVFQTVRPPSDQPPPIIGYTVSNNVTVTIRDIGKSGPILDAVVKAGANRVSGISFDISDRKSAEDGAIKAAIAEARHRGELLAEAAGVRLVRVISVNASTDNNGPVPQFARNDFALAAAQTPVLPGERAVTAEANITWEIAPK
jgi:uncharacterized protein YggE